MDEQPILAAILDTRSAYDRLAGRLDPNDFSEYGQLILKAAVQFYARDPAAQTADRDVVGASIQRLYPSAKQSSSVLDYLANLPSDVSAENVVTEYRLLRRRRIGLELAGALGDRHPADEKIDRLIDKYRELSIEQQGEKPRPTLTDLSERSGKRIRLHPAPLNDELNGGLLRGDHVVIIGRPNAAKTMFAINQSVAILRQGYRVLYICNEETSVRYLPRFLSRFSGGKYTWSDIEKDPEGVGAEAEALALERGLDRLTLLHEPGGKLSTLESLVRRHKPDVLVVDQMRNLKAGGSNRVLELEEVAREIRNLANTYAFAAFSLTQAGDSAVDKLHLTEGDVDWSNTAIQGACDLIVTLGSDAKYRAHNRRMVGLVKNKLGPRDSYQVMFLEPDYNVFLSKPRRRR